MDRVALHLHGSDHLAVCGREFPSVRSNYSCGAALLPHCGHVRMLVGLRRRLVANSMCLPYLRCLRCLWTIASAWAASVMPALRRSIIPSVKGRLGYHAKDHYASVVRQGGPETTELCVSLPAKMRLWSGLVWPSSSCWR